MPTAISASITGTESLERKLPAVSISSVSGGSSDEKRPKKDEKMLVIVGKMKRVKSVIVARTTTGYAKTETRFLFISCRVFTFSPINPIDHV